MKEDTNVSNEMIDPQLIAKMFLAAAQNLDANKEYINELNVFPVPDGDTGTNMTMTIMSAAKDVQALSGFTMPELCKAISSGSLRGARGNSGVILSQILRGFTKSVRDLEIIDIPAIAEACERATETAYKAVMKPKEGTILTVARGISEKAKELAADPDITMEVFLDELIKYGDETLDKTPDLLPVLKQAGVVDSGGKGLMTVLYGVRDGYLGKEIKMNLEPIAKKPHIAIIPKADIDTANIKFGYCTEFIVNLPAPVSDETVLGFKAFLESIGDSIVCVADDEYIKIHVHTNHPGQAFEKALEYGPLSRMKIDNMRMEHQEKLVKDASLLAAMEEAEKAAKKILDDDRNDEPENIAPTKKYGFISVCVGDGLTEIFKSLNVDVVVSGGQTMNPSTENFIRAIDEINAENIYILPNNKNIIMAAQQAAQLTKDKNIIVIPTATVPQGIASIIAFSPESEVDENKNNMVEAAGTIKTGSVTYAVRNTCIDDKEIKENDIMGICDGKILAVGEDVMHTTAEMVSGMVDDDSSFISIYYGSDVKEEDAQALLDTISEQFPDIDIDLQPGGQPVYYYIISVE